MLIFDFPDNAAFENAPTDAASAERASHDTEASRGEMPATTAAAVRPVAEAGKESGKGTDIESRAQPDTEHAPGAGPIASRDTPHGGESRRLIRQAGRHDSTQVSKQAAGHTTRRRRLTFDHPIDILQAHAPSEVRAVLRAVEAATTRGLYAAGFVSYEAAPAFDEAHEVRGGGTLPLAWFGIYRAPVVSAAPDEDERPLSTAVALEPDVDRATYDAAVTGIREAIARGDVYQVNYTFPLRGRLSAEAASPEAARALYEPLARAGHGGYSACLDIGTHRLLSFSPELFFERVGDRVTCRPMKGTAARGRWAEEDEARARWLASSEKNRAENVMIVDLVRNDLGRVARVGGVRVPALCAIERYPTVWQMTSTVEADLRPGVTLEQLFEALFPCGSITGAPKISAMHQIAALESSPRGVYCGAIGIVSPDRTVFNVAIRTLTIDAARQTMDYRVGGGVTWDSHSREEYAEARAKAALLQPRPPFSLIETLRLQDGRLVRLERHLARLSASARYFDMPVDEPRLREQLQAQAAAHPHGCWRLRLLLSPAGIAEITLREWDAPGPAPVPTSVVPAPPAASGDVPTSNASLTSASESPSASAASSAPAAAVAAGPAATGGGGHDGAAHGPSASDAPCDAAASSAASFSAASTGGAGLSGLSSDDASSSGMADSAASPPRIVMLAATPVDPEDPFLCHKTTNRRVYDDGRAAVPAALAAQLFDLLLWNTRGELTEFTIGNLVLDLDGARLTPPRASGLLAGTFRDELLDEGVIAERVLTAADLRRARAIWLINSLREWVRVTLDD